MFAQKNLEIWVPMVENALEILRMSRFCESFLICNGQSKVIWAKNTSYGLSCQKVEGGGWMEPPSPSPCTVPVLSNILWGDRAGDLSWGNYDNFQGRDDAVLRNCFLTLNSLAPNSKIEWDWPSPWRTGTSWSGRSKSCTAVPTLFITPKAWLLSIGLVGSLPNGKRSWTWGAISNNLS